MELRTLGLFDPDDAVNSHRRTREHLDAVHALGAETIGLFAVWPHLAYANDNDVRFELE
jgi:hypothetical protein